MQGLKAPKRKYGVQGIIALLRILFNQNQQFCLSLQAEHGLRFPGHMAQISGNQDPGLCLRAAPFDINISTIFRHMRELLLEAPLLKTRPGFKSRTRSELVVCQDWQSGPWTYLSQWLSCKLVASQLRLLHQRGIHDNFLKLRLNVISYRHI